MSDFFISQQEAQQASLDADLAPSSGEGDLSWGESVVGSVQAALGTLSAVGSRAGELFSNLPNTALETPSYLLPENARNRDATRALTDPNYGHQTDLARYFEEQRIWQEDFVRAHRPDPARMGQAQTIVSGIVEGLTPALVAGPLGAGGSAAAFGAASGERTYTTMLDNGVDEDTATDLAIQDTYEMAAAATLPGSLQGKLIARLLSGAAINAGVGVWQRESTGRLLRERGYDELADQYRWDDAEAAAIDLGIGAIFGGVLGHGPTALRDSPVADALLVQQDVLNRRRSAPGFPADVAAARAHSEALRMAEEQAASDDPIEVSPARVEEQEYVSRDDIEAMAADVEAARTALSERPPTLTAWVRRQGGIADDRGDVAGQAGDNLRGFARLLRRDGRTLDDLAVKAWEDGFFSETPTRQQFIDALNEDAAGRIHEGTTADEFAARNARDVLRYYEAEGVDVSLRGDALRQAVEAMQSERLQQAIRSALEENGFADRISDLEAAQARARARGIDPEAFFSFGPGKNRRRLDLSTADIVAARDRLRAEGVPEHKIIQRVADDLGVAYQAVHRRVKLPPKELAARIESEAAAKRERGATPYNQAAIGRLLDEAEKLANTRADRQLVSGFAGRLAEATGYAESSVSFLMNSARRGVYGAALQARALTIGGARAGKWSEERVLIAGLIDAGKSNAEILRQVNIQRAAKPGVEPMAPGTLRTTMSHIRRERREGTSFYALNDRGGFSTVSDLHAAAQEAFGASWDALSRAGYAEVVQSAAEVPREMFGITRSALAVHLRDRGQTYFIANNIRPEDMKGLILHEIGVHHGMEAMLGKRGINALYRQLNRMLEAGHPDVMGVRAFVEHRYPENHWDSETLANLIEKHADLPLVQSLMAKVRQWLVRTFGSSFGLHLTVDDMRALALASLRRVAKQAQREAGPVVIEEAPLSLAASYGPDAGQWHTEQLWHGTHETNGPIEVFDMSRVGQGSGAGTGERAAFFTPERRLAEAFGPAHPYEVRGRLLEYDANGQSYKHLNMGEILERARNEGYAGVRFRQPWETHQYIGNPQHDPLDGVRFSDQIAIFDPANIRPARSVPDGGAAQGGQRAPRRIVDITTPRGETHQTIVNPTEADIMRLTNPSGRITEGSQVERGVPSSARSRVRYIRHGDDIYVGNSYDVTHHDLVTNHNLPNRGSLDGGEILRHPDGSLELQNNDGAMPLPRGWLRGQPPAVGDRQLVQRSLETGEEFPLFSFGPGKNGDGRYNDPALSERFVNVVDQTRAKLRAEGLVAPGALGEESRVGPQGARTSGRDDQGSGRAGAGGQRSGRGDQGQGARGVATREQVQALLRVSGIRIKSIAGEPFGDHVALIDAPLDLEPALARALGEKASGKAGSYLEFDLDKGGERPSITLRLSYVDETARFDAETGASNGVGGWLYRQLINWAFERGYAVKSDTMLSPHSQRVYESMRREGYEVVRNHTAEFDEAGWLSSHDGNKRAVFEIRPGEETVAPSAAPRPPGGYQIDGPSLKERMAPILEQRRAEEERAAKSPYEQALDDDPDKLFSYGARSVEARALMDNAIAERRAAEEMRAGMEAAARCGARQAAEAGARRSVSYVTAYTARAAGGLSRAGAATAAGHALGLTTAVPVGIFAAPMLAQGSAGYREAQARRRLNAANERQALARRRLGEVARRGRDVARERGRQAGLDAPVSYVPMEGVPLNDAIYTHRVDMSTPGASADIPWQATKEDFAAAQSNPPLDMGAPEPALGMAEGTKPGGGPFEPASAKGEE